MGKSLYQIANEYCDLLDRIEENDGIVSDDINEQLTIFEDQLEDKLRSYKAVIDNQKYYIDYNKDEIKRLRERNQNIDKNIDRLKSYVKQALYTFGNVGKSGNYKIEYPDFSVSTRAVKSTNVDENSMSNILETLAHPTVNHFTDDEKFIREHLETALNKVGSIDINLKISLNDFSKIVYHLNELGIKDFGYEWKFDKKALNELDEYANKLADNSNNLSEKESNELKAIDILMNLISYERKSEDTVIFK